MENKKWRFREDMLGHYINNVSSKTFQDAEDRLNFLEEANECKSGISSKIGSVEYKDNMDVLNNGTEEEKKIVLESFMYWLNSYKPHKGLVSEWLEMKPKTNCYGKIILG